MVRDSDGERTKPSFEFRSWFLISGIMLISISGLLFMILNKQIGWSKLLVIVSGWVRTLFLNCGILNSTELLLSDSRYFETLKDAKWHGQVKFYL